MMHGHTNLKLAWEFCGFSLQREQCPCKVSCPFLAHSVNTST